MKAIQRNPRPPLVSIIIPVFNKAALTMQCLTQLAAVTRRVAHEIIVVDNASTDDTPQLLKRGPAQLRVIRNALNRGFACACNQGASAATGEYLLFLNNDTIPLDGWLEALVDELHQHSEVAAVGAKLIYASGLVQHAGVAFERETRNPYHPYRLLRADHSCVNHRRQLQAVTAACVLIRPRWFHACKGFCEDYRNGYEDLDLCLKIRSQGGSIVYQPKSVVIHLESQTPGRMGHDNENRALFFSKWSDTILSDEDAFYFRDGYRILGRWEQRLEQPQLLRLNSEAERTQWSTVARAQELAAARRRDELLRLLAQSSLWPQDGAVRRWAGSLCLRLNAKQAAGGHFEAALSFSNDPELRLLLAANGPGLQANRPNGGLPWEQDSRSAFELLRSGEPCAAQEAFERALSLGGPPRLLLPALWQAANDNGSAALADLVRQAMLTFPPSCGSLALRLAAGIHTRAALADSGPGVGAMPADAMPKPLVSIIILVFNQWEHTHQCLESLAAFTKMPHEIILVDNGSDNRTQNFLEQWLAAHPHCNLIRNSSNRGFAAGNNQALSIARGEHLLLLNNDTVVTENWLEAMLKVLERFPEAGVVGPMSNNVSGPQHVAGVTYRDLDGMPEFAAQWRREHQGQSFEINRAVGFCLLARRAVFENIGGLDEQFGSGNFEDDDFCIRARLAGFSVRIAREVFIHHTGSQTFRGAGLDYRKAMLRNWDLFRKKWQLSPDSSLEHGYQFPKCLPPGVAPKAPLPKLSLTHSQTAPNHWLEPATASRRAEPRLPKVPGVAGAGSLEKTHARVEQRDLPGAWQAAVEALKERPFHPPAYLILAEIACDSGDAQSARQCARWARELTPEWKAPKLFLQRCLKGKSRPGWLSLPDEAVSSVTSNNETTARLTVCLITKNEEEFLQRCLKSVKDLAYQIVVVDTGSTDRTVEIAKSFGAEVHLFEWVDDFSAARNAALEHARGDWVLILDADEELPPDQHARLRADLKNRKDIALRLPLVNQGQEAEGRSYVPRLFRNAPGVYFTGRIHEQVFPSLVALGKTWGLGTGLGTAQILHHGYTAEAVKDRNKIERNLRLLRLAVEEDPADANLAMNLGLEMVRSGDLQGGLLHYRRAFDLVTAKPASETAPELREALLTQFTAHLYKQKAHHEVVEILTSPLAKHAGLTASLHFALGLAYFESGKYLEAGEQMRQCLAKRRQTALTPINTDILTAAPHHCLALSLAKGGDPVGAEKAFQAGMSESGRREEVRLDYAKFLVEQNRPVDALHRLHELITENGQSAAAWRLGGQIALDRPEFLEFAADWTGEALKQLPEDQELLAQRAEVLLLSRQLEAAAELWHNLEQKGYGVRATAAWVLCEILAGGPVHDSALEPEVGPITRAFIDWYQRCLALQARQLLAGLNERLDALRQVLPAAAGLIESALTEAGRETEPTPELCPA